MRQILRSGFEELGVAASEEAIAALERYAALLEEKNKVMNLTAIRGEEDVARLHFLDCGALLRYIRPEGKRLLDVGSGAGFPGLPLLLAEPSLRLTLLDSQGKRVRFLEELCARLGVEAECIQARAEEQVLVRDAVDDDALQVPAVRPVVNAFQHSRVRDCFDSSRADILVRVRGRDPLK